MKILIKYNSNALAYGNNKADFLHSCSKSNCKINFDFKACKGTLAGKSKDLLESFSALEKHLKLLEAEISDDSSPDCAKVDKATEENNAVDEAEARDSEEIDEVDEHTHRISPGQATLLAFAEKKLFFKFKEIQAEFPDVAKSTLANRLKKLTEEGYIDNSRRGEYIYNHKT